MRLILVAAAMLWSVTTLVVASQQPAPSPTPQASPAAPPQPAPEKKVNRFADVEEEDEFAEPETVTSLRRFYSGTKACTKCHEKQAKVYGEGPHAREWNGRTPAADIGCETCHGPGKAHDDAPAVKGLIKGLKNASREASDVCLTCHSRDEHAAFEGSLHDARGVSCVSCHSVHKPQSARGHLKHASVTATCGQCHADKSAKMQRASHMPVREGKMECSSCHNAHGSTNVRMLRVGDNVNDSCLSCHTEKRGPFLWEHKPVTESCVTCHDAHGSSNERMLPVKTTMLCQRCHIATRHPATPYDGLALASGNNRLINRGCINCHQMVHGSNHPSGVFLVR